MVAADSAGDGATDGRKKQRRRVIIPPPEGTDINPDPEPDRFSDDENAERLTRDKPPHWG